MNEEELKQKEQELIERENALAEREQELAEKEQDTQALVKQIKDEYENKLAKQRISYENRLKERENVIKQLLSDGNANNPPPSIVDLINAKRHSQNKKW